MHLKYILIAIFLISSICSIGSVENNLTAQFTPPKDWRFAEIEALPKHVHVMVVGKGDYPFPPSINLGTELYAGTLAEYLQIVKAINDADGAEWKNLGTIETEAGPANLSQVDSSTEWGKVRMMHVILLKEGTAYILTAAALCKEFSKFYPQFFRSMKTLRLIPSIVKNENEKERGAIKSVG